MEILNQLDLLLPMACKYVAKHEQIILQKGVPLTPDQKIDAYQIGVQDIDQVRLMQVDRIPLPKNPVLNSAVKLTGLISRLTAGITFRYGIYIRSDCWNQRRLIVHELTHTMQYERMGGIRPFLTDYLNECLTVGYPNGPMEQEAVQMEKQICG